MRFLTPLLVAAIAATSFTTVAPAAARDHRYENSRSHRYYNARNGRRYQSYAECKRSRSRAAKRGTVIGAVGAGGAAALLGGNLGESLLGAGVGAVAGNALGRGSKRTC
jgi:outer membrane lipoprotein SlyB